MGGEVEVAAGLARYEEETALAIKIEGKAVYDTEKDEFTLLKAHRGDVVLPSVINVKGMEYLMKQSID
ncbi:uncharacterized protein MONOS_18011 [Monocercomonoides exilis]|uniref:uncharacterized protein n=1 Tax=Monocercomonoides exilis TaxID=2049356 RepID=UPI00355AB08F|nr:hypothetical protein MONOS_18011 [Monocercomonoides exilis]